MLGSILVLISIAVSAVESLRCWRCEGERIYDENWLTHKGKCCLPRVVRCKSATAYCLVAHVEGSMSFWISGCNDDKFVGCDSHRIPFNSTLTRCQCDKDLCNPIGRIPSCAATRRSTDQLMKLVNGALRNGLRGIYSICCILCICTMALLRLNENVAVE